MSGLSLIERLADKQLIEQMSQGEKAIASLQVTAIGMGITFAVLMLLWALISIMAKVVSNAEKKNPLAPAVSNATSVASPVMTPAVSSGADEELVAVITAAIAASLQRQDIIVKNIMRTPQKSLAWANVAKQEQLDSRRF